MSASNKKKLRKEQNNDFLSEKQQKQQSEDKKLKIYTIAFVCAMAVVVCVALGILAVRGVNNSGIIQKNTVAATVGDRELSSVEMSYYYVDAVNSYYNEWYSYYSDSTDTYLEALGLDTSIPLDQQTYDEETGQTWAEYFLETALDQAASDYAMYDLAQEAGFTLSTEEQETLDSTLSNIEVYSTLYGYNNANQYLRASYGYGAELDSYSEYYERSTIADAYYNAYPDTLTYDEAAISTYDQENGIKFNSYTYTSCYMSYTAFREGGTEDEEGNITYSDAENDAARAAMQAAAEAMATATTDAELQAKAAEVTLTDGTELTVTENENVLYSSINATLAEWLAAEDRKDGDVAAIPNTSTTENEDGTETTVTNGYYVVIYHGSTDNVTKLGNVRHLLVSFEGGTEDEETGETVYSDEEKNTAKTTAEGYLADWLAGDATEDSFIALVQEYSDDSTAEDGGLFENVAPDGTYVEAFQNWALDEAREPGDTEVIETEYGYHVMYYVGDGEMNYRQHMITEEMRSADFEAWYTAATESVTTALADTSKMNLGLTLTSA